MATSHSITGRTTRALPGTPASELLNDPAITPYSCIVTFVQDFDAILGGALVANTNGGGNGGGGGGIRLGEVTELTGPAGAGKTTLALQLALDVQIPADTGGCDGEAVYIDTEGGVHPDRLYEMAAAVHVHLKRILSKRDAAYLQARPALTHQIKEGCTPTRFLERIYMFRPMDLEEMLRVLSSMPAFLTTHPNVKLVVVDSIAFHFRYGQWAVHPDFSYKQRSLAIVGKDLQSLAETHKVAVVITNQLTTKLGGGGGGGVGSISASANSGGGDAAASAYLSSLIEAGGGNVSSATDGGGERGGGGGARIVPSLGDFWAHIAATRIHLRYDTRIPSATATTSSSSPLTAGYRIAFVTKSCGSFPSPLLRRPPHSAVFLIGPDGVRGMRAPSSSSSSSSSSSGTRANSNSGSSNSKSTTSSKSESSSKSNNNNVVESVPLEKSGNK